MSMLLNSCPDNWQAYACSEAHAAEARAVHDKTNWSPQGDRTVEGVIGAAILRLAEKHLALECRETGEAQAALLQALGHLHARETRRGAHGVLGTDSPAPGDTPATVQQEESDE